MNIEDSKESEELPLMSSHMTMARTLLNDGNGGIGATNRSQELHVKETLIEVDDETIYDKQL